MVPNWLLGGKGLPVTRGIMRNARKNDAVELIQKSRIFGEPPIRSAAAPDLDYPSWIEICVSVFDAD